MRFIASPHYLSLSFNGTDSQSVFFKKIKPLGKISKKALQFIYSVKYILKMLQNIFISHKSTVLSGLDYV